jgi:hypothetical protein
MSTKNPFELYTPSRRVAVLVPKRSLKKIDYPSAHRRRAGAEKRPALPPCGNKSRRDFLEIRQVLPRHRVVGRFFAWINRNRRLAKLTGLLGTHS